MVFTEEFTKLRNTHRHCVDMFYTEFHPNRPWSTERFRLFSTAGLSLSRFYEPGACSTVFFFKEHLIYFALCSFLSWTSVISSLPAFSFFSFQFGTARNSVTRYALITGASAILPVCEMYARYFLVGISTDFHTCTDSTTNRLLHTYIVNMRIQYRPYICITEPLQRRQ